MPKYNICASSVEIHLRYMLVNRWLFPIAPCVTNWDTEMQNIDSANVRHARDTSGYTAA